ncbi:MAG: efflux transporter outer membrane subunit [Pseudomonadota bacterium]
MVSLKNTNWLGAALLSVTLPGCMLTPSPESLPTIDETMGLERYFSDRSSAVESVQTSEWWIQVGGANLDAMVETLRRDSLTLKEARLQAEQALLSAKIAGGQRLPSVLAFSDISTSRAPDFTGDFSWSEAYSAGLLLDFDTDIFGRLRATQRAAQLNAIASQLVISATEQREIAALAKNYVSASALERRLALANRTAESFRATYDLTNQRYAGGSEAVSASDVQIALQNLETALVDIPQIETDLAKQFLIIDEQLARSPGETQSSYKGSAIPYSHFSISPGRPASLLARRPDVAAAELRYLAALEDIGAARANLYPTMALSASLTFQGDTPDEVFDWDQYISSLASSLTAPVFQGGRIRAQIQVEEARADELANAFARTMLAAVIDVELALSDLTGLETQRDQLNEALKTARLSNELAQGRYQQGLTSLLSVLETQRSLNAAEQNLILTEQAILNARIDLFLSLGGDWSGRRAVGQTDRTGT